MAHMKFEIFKSKKNPSFGFFYLMTVGVLLAWVIVAGIIDTTIFQRNHTASLIRMLFIVGIFGLVFSYKYIMRAGIGLFTLGALFIISGFLFTPVEPNLANRIAELISMTFQFITGNRPHTIAYETLTIWTISLFFGFFVVFFSYHKFRFWILFAVSAATTSLAITSSYFRDTRIFYTYVFCILALVVIYLHQRNIDKMATPPKASIFSKLIIPLIAGIVLFTSIIPPLPVFSQGLIRNIVRAPFEFINDIFLNITLQSEFSLRQVGFGESGGRLGGDIEPNDRVFMQIRTNIRMPVYLTGATRDTYTGYSWVNLHNEYRSVDFDAFDQSIELAERVTSQNNNIWLQYMIEAVASGRLVQVDLAERFDDDYWDSDDTGGWQIFVDETTGHEIWAIADQSINGDIDEYTWYIDFSNPDHLHFGGFRNRIQVDSLDRRLTTIFYTGMLQNIDVQDEELSFLRNRDGRLLSERRLGHNTIYAIYYHDMHYYDRYAIEHSYRGILQDVSDMMEMFRQNYGYHIGFTRYMVDGTIISHEDLLNDHLIPRADRIHEIYTALPDTFPERVHELALEVTEEASNNYERMRLLERFLNENFVYTLTPGPSPIDQDFVDHFLFDLQQGYCVHFATAFVTMARSLGMPTRYVEGFYINAPGMRDEDIDVLNRMAHAWPEVYFEGYGWLRFEPTPASELLQQQGDSDSSPTPGLGIWHDPELDMRDFDPSLQPPVNEDLADGSGNGGSQQNVGLLTLPTWIWGGLVMLVVAILIFGRVMLVHLKHSRIRKKESNTAAIGQFKILLSYLKFLGFEIKETETAIQFAERIQNYFSQAEFEKELLKSSAKVFAKARYSKQEISKVECAVLEKLIHRMDIRVQLQLGKWKYFIYRYILAKV